MARFIIENPVRFGFQRIRALELWDVLLIFNNRITRHAIESYGVVGPEAYLARIIPDIHRSLPDYGIRTERLNNNDCDGANKENPGRRCGTRLLR